MINGTHFSAYGANNLKTNSMTPIFFGVIIFGIQKGNYLIILKKFYEADFLQVQKRVICKYLKIPFIDFFRFFVFSLT